MQQIKLGTIGSGVIVHSILSNAMRVGDIRLVAVYSRSRERGEALAAKFGGEKVYTDMDAFLADPEVEVVYIATPNLLHYEQAKRALLAGKHVILEKPFCTKAAHARELVELARQRGQILVDATPTGYLPNLDIVKEQLPKIGRIKLVMSNFSQYSSRYDLVLAGERPNIFNPEFAGGCLMDINYYNLYLNAALFGKPRQAVYYPNLYEGLADTSGVLILSYNGFVSQNAGAKDTWGVNFFQIEGEKGFLYLGGGGNAIDSVRVVTKTSDETINVQAETDRWYYEVRNVKEAFLRDDRDYFNRRLDVMLDVMEVLENSRKAAGIYFPGD